MFKKIVFVLAMALCFTSAAHATLLLTVNRTSDQTATVTGTGTLDTPLPSDNQHLLSLDNIFGNALTGYENDNALDSSTFMVGNILADFAYTAGSGWDANGTGNPILYFGSGMSRDFSVGDAVDGALNLSLQSGYSFASVGSTGSVYWGPFGTTKQLVGSYEIIDSSAVPEPISIALLGLGLAGFAVARRKSAK